MKPQTVGDFLNGKTFPNDIDSLFYSSVNDGPWRWTSLLPDSHLCERDADVVPAKAGYDKNAGEQSQCDDSG